MCPNDLAVKEDKGGFIARGSKGFLSDVRELEHQFTRAAESCHEVLRMLETMKIRLRVFLPRYQVRTVNFSAVLFC